jgi:hypothetical protein
MKVPLKKAFLMALPLAGLLFVSAPNAEARSWHHKHHKRDYHCDTDYGYKRGWQGRGRYHNYKEGWRGWQQRPYYDNNQYYPSRSPYDTYNDRPYYGGYPWWSHFTGR